MRDFRRVEELKMPRFKLETVQFIASAAAEKMASVMTLDHLKSEAGNGTRSVFEHYLGSVQDVPAMPGDELA